MGGRIREHDWSATPLGPIETWPASLKAAVEITLGSNHATCLAWGRDRTLIYNDPYARVLAQRDRGALGASLLEVWPELADELAPALDQASSGTPIAWRHGPALLAAGLGGSLTAVHDDDGAFGGLFCACHEATARDQAGRQRGDEHNAQLEAQVAERTRERDRIWRSSQDLLVVLGPDGVFQAVNPAWNTILGWRPEELIGFRFDRIVHPDDLAATISAGRLAAAEALRAFENRYRHKDGSYRWFSWTAAPEDGVIYAIGRHVTAEKAAAEALRAAEERLHQAQKMEAVGQLTGGIAHDFNNMLQAVSGSLELMRRRVAQGRAAEVTRYVDAAMQSVERATALTHRLLAFARRQALQPRPIEPDALIKDLADLIQRTVGPSIKLALRMGDGVWTVLCDPNQLESVLLNLAINARDGMPEGGTLTVATRDVQFGAADVAAPDGHRPGDYVEICVSDTGHGMTADVLTRAFEPFFTTKPVGQGTGLGLSQLHGFVHQSGGFVRLDSVPDLGTTVRLYLPRHTRSRGQSARAPQAARTAEQGSGATVLVVEDEAAVRGLVAESLREMGCRVLEAEDGPSGLRILLSGETVDLLVTDVGLPGLNGRQLADAGRERRPGMPVLLITGYFGAAPEDAQLAPEMQLIGKPFNLDALTTRVAHLLHRSGGTRAS